MNGRIATQFNEIHFNKQEKIEREVEDLKMRLSNARKSKEDIEQICQLSLTALQDRLREKQLTPLDLLQIFQQKAINLYESGNSGICEFIKEAEEQAVHLANIEPPLSALHGIPISVKELCTVRGYDSTFGLLKLCSLPAEEDCAIIKTLKAVGAIPFVLTATSQLALTVSGYNPVSGDMRNPVSEKHLPGGSSTGEAVLLAQHGSPVGIGTDVAGSIRIPSAFCGLTGLKPTSQRLGYRGGKNLFTGSSLVLKVAAGPMGKRVDDLVTVMRALLCPALFHADPTVPPLLFNEDLYRGVEGQSLKIGYYDNLNDPNVIQTVPSVRRAVREAVKILENAGCTMVKFEIPNPLSALKLGFAAMIADGGQEIKSYLKNEPLNEHSKKLDQFVSIPHVFRSTLDAGIRWKLGKPAATVSMVRKLSNISEITGVINDIETYREQFDKALIAAGDLDIVIGPAWPFPAPKDDTQIHFINPAVIYTSLYNLLDYPAGVVPMGIVGDEDIEEAKELAADFKAKQDTYHMELMASQQDSKGLPLSVQVVGRPYQEEMVLRVMKMLESDRETSD